MKYLNKNTSLAFALLIFCILSFNKGIAQNNDPINTITIEELKNHMYFLASDFLGGRVADREGYKMAAEYCATQFKSIGLKPAFKDNDGKLSYFQKVVIAESKTTYTIVESDTIIKEIPERFTYNIGGILKGTDNNLSADYITLGAHLDHVQYSKTQIYNGADDNASGSVGVIEIAEAMVKAPPKRSVMFLLWGAEEMGLIGSRYFLNNPPVPIKNITFNINLDMIGRSTKDNKNKRTHNVVIYKKYFNKMKKLISEANKSINWPLNYMYSRILWGDSDHSSFHKKGIPNFFLFSGMHEDLHRPSDDAEKIDYEKMQKICQLTFIIANKLANSEKLDF